MQSLPSRSLKLLALPSRQFDVLVIFLLFSALYAGLGWLINGGDRWWIIDFIHDQNIFYGDDAYRFFLARSAWLDPSLYAYNFDLPVNLFLENIVVTLAGGDLLWARYIHALIAAASLCLVWRSGLILGVDRAIMVGAMLVMGLMPLYALVSLSFYGEAWLGFALCLGIWLFLRESRLPASLVIGLLPLIRPEGIFFLAPLWFYMVKKKYWRESILLILPGFIYFLFLLISLPDIQDFFYWRAELRRILMKFPYDSSAWLLPSTYSALLTLPALLGFLFLPLRKLWPFIVGGGVWALFLQAEILTGLAYYEPRYGFSLIPLIVIMWASFVAWIFREMRRVTWVMECRHLAVGALSLLLVIQHIADLTALKKMALKEGWSGVISTALHGEWQRIFPAYLPGYMESYKQMSKKIHKLLKDDESIDRLVMFDSFLYYFIDPHELPGHVRVDYPALGYLVFHVMLDGQIFTQHSGGRMYSYLRFSEPGLQVRERRALYADAMPMPNYPYRWEMDGVQLYLFSYKEAHVPDVELSKAPSVDPEVIQEMYRRVFAW